MDLISISEDLLHRKKKKGKHLENATQLAIFDGYINAYEL